jgi:hypothetical protein
MENSTNGHYIGLQRYSQNAAVRDDVPVADTCAGDRGFSMYRDHINVEALDIAPFDKNVAQCIWNDSNVVRLVKRKKYNEQTIELEVTGTLQEAQVKYLLGDITEPTWRRVVYQQHMKNVMSTLYGDVLNIYLAMVDMFQQELALSLTRPPANERERYMANIEGQFGVLEKYGKLVELCNDSFESIQEEYGGPSHHIRSPLEDLNAPAFI